MSIANIVGLGIHHEIDYLMVFIVVGVLVLLLPLLVYLTGTTFPKRTFEDHEMPFYDSPDILSQPKRPLHYADNCGKYMASGTFDNKTYIFKAVLWSLVILMLLFPLTGILEKDLSLMFWY